MTSATLSFLLGSFDGAERMFATRWAPAGVAVSRVEAAAEVAGSVVVQRYEQRRDGDVCFEMVTVWTTDHVTGEIVNHSFDTAGFPADPPARGTWRGADLVLDRETPRGASRLVLTPTSFGWSWSRAFRAPDAADWELVQRADFRPVAGS